MPDTTPAPAFDFAKILQIVVAVVQFTQAHPELIPTVTAVVKLVEDVVTAIQAANTPKA